METCGVVSRDDSNPPQRKQRSWANPNVMVAMAAWESGTCYSSEREHHYGSMIHRAKDLSPDQRLAIESLLGRSISDNEEIVIRTSELPPAPEWLRRSWESAQEQGLDRLSTQEIDAEIATARKARHDRNHT